MVKKKNKTRSKRKSRDEGFFSKKNMMSIFIVAIMVFSIFGVLFYGFNDTQGATEDYGLEFVPFGNAWKADINGKEVEVDLLPSDVSYVEINDTIISKLENADEIKITSSLNDSYISGIALGQYRIALNLEDTGHNIKLGALSKNEFGLDVINCNESRANSVVVYFKEGESFEVTEDECIIIQASSDMDFVRASHKILYELLGVY